MKLMLELLVTAIAILPAVAVGRALDHDALDAMEKGAGAKIVIRVCDEAGLQISNASVRVEFDLLPHPHSVFGKTDSSGVVVVRGKTNGNKIGVFVAKEGYYCAHKEMSFIAMGGAIAAKKGKWLPYGVEVSVCLKPIRNPLKMSSSLVVDYKFTSAINKWIGYDIAANDFIQPYGSGIVSDFEVCLDWDRVYSLSSRQIGFKVRFTDPYSGYCALSRDDISDLDTPYSVPADATFLKDAEFYSRRDGKRMKNTFDKSKCWVVRSRCKVDDKGELLESNYSVVRYLGVSGSRDLKAGFAFCGAFNPTPNDTNLEDIEIAKRSRAFIRQCEPPPTP